MNEVLKENYKKRIYITLDKANRKAIGVRDLAAKCRTKRNGEGEYAAALTELLENGVIFKYRSGYAITRKIGCFCAKVKRLSKTFGFIERLEDGAEVFVPGKYLLGALPGDIVIAKLITARRDRPEAEVVSIAKADNPRFSGEIYVEKGQLLIIPDTLMKTPIRLEETDLPLNPGDKVLAEITFRAERHAEHRAQVIMSFGTSSTAENCIKALLAERDIVVEFPAEVLEEADKIASAGISREEIDGREDLRGETIFTIDGADSKDLDDAVSIAMADGDYLLDVHIADVSHYVQGHSALDNEALRRGTSIYYADTVIPMLPKPLSNGICSLNPGEDRLAVSCHMRIDAWGSLISFEFKKSVIRSCIKGIYHEVNAILSNTANAEIEEKYADVRSQLFLMEKLTNVLKNARKRRGAPMLETAESKIILDENGKCCAVKARESGASENIIEEFMLMANRSAATLAREKQIPFVYRVHEPPAEDKIVALQSVVRSLGMNFPSYTQFSPVHMSNLIDSARERAIFPVINTLALRSMAKAKYFDEPLGHFGLALDDYAHFTSPIRRYPDLAIHRILSELLAGNNVEKIRNRFDVFVHKAAEKSSTCELNAIKLERDCDARYKAEYMRGHIGEEFTGIISSVTERGFYVSLPDTVEGFVPLSLMPQGVYTFDEPVRMVEVNSGAKYTMGNTVTVRCEKADVSSGNIDFSLIIDKRENSNAG